MKVLFIGTDNFWAEGVKYILEELYAETVKFVSMQNDITCNYQSDILYDKYDIIFIDLMSYNPIDCYKLYPLLTNITKRVVFTHSFNSTYTNFHANLMNKRIMISKDISINKIRAKLMAPFTYSANRINCRNHHQSGLQRSYALMNDFELEVIRSISTGEKVKSVAIRMNKSDKTLYQLLSRVKLRMGFKNKHEFLFFLTTFNAFEKKL